MRIKKGFTLAEILIVLMVIGVIATMTIPSLMKGVTEATFKTAYKKAYNTIVNLTAMERIAGLLPSGANNNEAWKLFASLNSNLSVKEYAKEGVNTGGTYANSDFHSGIIFKDSAGYKIESKSKDDYDASSISIGDSTPSPWIVTEDNLAYAVIVPQGATCGTKAQINGADTQADAAKATCAVVVVDVNGLSKGPNKYDDQTINGLDGTQMLAPLVGDQYYIFVGSDGATSGDKRYTVSGRIISDIK